MKPANKLKASYDYKSRKENGLPIFKCKNNYLHIFLSRQALEHHVRICDSLPQAQNESLEQILSPVKEQSILGKREREKDIFDPLEIKKDKEKEILYFSETLSENQKIVKQTIGVAGESREQRLLNKRATLEFIQSL